MHILCPHCHNPIEVVKLTPREDIACPSCGSSFRLETDSTTGWEPRAGQRLGKFELLETVGHGAFGTVYKARDPELDRVVAVKVPRAGNLAGPHDLARFLREARSVAQLRHPSIVSVHEVGAQDGVLYLVSDFVCGVTLADLLSARRLGFREAAELVAAVAAALHYAHEYGVVHRDVKPSNIMIGEDGTPCVMDFGLAKREAGEITMTVEGQVLGTPAYMPPEQARGEGHAVDARGDVYSLGVVLYQLLTGELPFRGTQRMLLHQVLHDEPRPPRRLNDLVPRDLETIALRAMAKEPGRRYPTARALADDLRRWLNGEAIQARPVGRLEQAARWVRHNPVLAGMTAVVVLTLLAGTAVSMSFDIAERQQAELAKKTEAETVARGKDLATANDTLTRTTDDLTRSRDDLKHTADDLTRSRDDLETALARSLLRPLAAQGDKIQAVSEPEWEALWELATNRRGRLGYRFVEEASRTPVTSRQLRDRASLALHAVVGMDAERRAEVEALLLARMEDPALGDEQKTNLALAASAWDDLSSSAAIRTARQLNRAIRDAKDLSALRSLTQAFSAAAVRMQPHAAATATAQIAATLGQAMKDTKDPDALIRLSEGLKAVADRLEPKDAAQAAAILAQAMKDTKDPNALSWLAQGLSAVSAQLEVKDAAQAAAILGQAMKDTKDSNALSSLAWGLKAVAGRLEAKDAAQAAATLVQAMKDTKDPNTLSSLAAGLSAVADRLEAKDAAAIAAPAAAILAQAIKDRKDWRVALLAGGLSAVATRLEAKEAAAILAQAMKDTKDFFALSSLAGRLSAVAARLEPRDAATILAQAINDTKDPTVLRWLAQGLSAVAVRLEAKDAAQAVATLVQAMKDAKDPNTLSPLAAGLSAVAVRLEAKDAAQVAAALIQAMKDTKDPNTLSPLAAGLSAVAVRLEAKDAAQAAATLAQAMKDTKNPNALSSLAQGLSVLADRLQAKDAASVSAQAAAILAQAMKDTKDPNALFWLARGLLAVAVHLEAKDAAAIAAQAAATLIQAIKDTRDPYTLSSLASGLSALAARMEPEDAATATAQTAAILVQVMKDTKNPNTLSPLAAGLSAVAGHLEAKAAAAIAAQAAATLGQAMKDTRDRSALFSLAAGLKAVAPHLEAKDAAQAAVILAQAMNDIAGDVRTKDFLTLSSLAESLSAVAARLEAKDAAQAAAFLVQATHSPLSPGGATRQTQDLSALLSAVPLSEIPTRSATAVAAVTLPVGTGHPLTTLAPLIRAAEPPPRCRLSTQQLVELLKLPAFVGEARRIVLDQLGNCYQRRFADVWEFVRYAKEQDLGLDFTSPPQRLEPVAPAR